MRNRFDCPALTVRRCAGTALRHSWLAALFLLSGCVTLEPWVKPHERGNLADPVMALDRHPAASQFMAHVYEIREGARGADGSAGGGCGCN